LKPIFDDLLQRQQPVGAAEARSVTPGHILHHQVGRDRVGHGVEDLHHVRVVQPAHQGRFGGEEALLEVHIAADRPAPVRTRLMATSRPWKSSCARKTSLVAPSPSARARGTCRSCGGSIRIHGQGTGAMFGNAMNSWAMVEGRGADGPQPAHGAASSRRGRACPRQATVNLSGSMIGRTTAGPGDAGGAQK
jgi:hypothetical protein